MPTIDDKVVAMSFESSKFESGVNSAISALDKLKSALKFDGAGKGLDEISNSAKKVDLSHIGNAIEDVKGRFTALSVAAGVVLAGIAQKAISAGANFAKSFTIEPIKAGFAEYATNLNAIQTILANTQASGATLTDVNSALNDLNHYSDKTIYNFSQMAKNIGTFTAAGVDLNTSTQAIKGIANLAALSGSNADQASTAMYQLSQAISAGRVGLQDWNSVVNAGMGGTVFQRALATTAENMGTLKEGTLKLVGPMKNVSINGESFRQSMQSGPGKTSWLTSKVLTETLKQFTGDLTDAQLKAKGFNDEQIKAIQQTAKTAQHAATEVKTISQVFDVAKETAGSGWAQTFQIIFGNFSEAKKTFTDLSNTINGFINTNAQARNKVLNDWKELGGRTVLIDSIKNAFKALGEIVAPIKDAFRDIFPPATGKDLYDLTLRFQQLTEMMKPSPETVENLHRTFAGLFAVLDIGKQIIQGIFTMFGKLFGAVSSGQGGFLSFTATIGDFLVSLDEALKKGNGIHDFFAGLGDILAVPIKLLEQLGHAIANLFGGFSSGGFSGQMDGMTKSLTPFQKVMEAVSAAWHNFIDNISSGHDILQSAVDGIIKVIEGLGPGIANALSSINWDTTLAIIRTGLFGALVVLLKNFFGKGSFLDQIGKGFGGGIIKNISGSFDALRGSMVAMQNNIKAKTLEEIAIAIGILTASVVALSFVNPDKLKSALTAITVMLGQLLGAMAIVDKIGSSGGFLKLPFIAGGLVILAGAIDILAIAVFALSKLSWEELLKGLTGVGALLIGISAASGPLSANSAGMIRAGIGIGAIAVAMKILASAIKDFGGMSWTEIGKGLVGVAGGLVAIAGATQLMPKSMVLTGAGLIAVAFALKLLVGVVQSFAGMDWGSIGKGLVGVGGALVIIAGAMQLMPINMPITAAGLLLVSVALGKIAEAVQSMGSMSLGEIARGLGTLAGALVILAAGLYAMSGSLAGAAALTVAAAGISLLAGALVKLGGQSWQEILKSLVTLAAALTILGIAGVALAPTVPALLGLGAALVLIGGGLALAGAGIFLISAGISALAVTGPAGIHVLIDAIIELTEAIPEMAKNMVLGLLAIVDQLAETAPKFVDAILKIINSLLDAIIKSAPKIADAFEVLITMALKVLHDEQPKIIQAGFDLLEALLKGIRNNISGLVSLVVDIIVKFIDAVSNNLNRIVTAGDNLLTSFIKGIVQHITNIVSTVVDIITKFVTAIGDNETKIITAGVNILVKFIEGLTKNISDLIKTGTDFIVTLIKGIEQSAQDIVTAAVNAMILFMNTLVKESLKLVNAGAIAIVNFLNGMANAIDAHSGEIRAAGVRVGVALINGLTGGLTAEAGHLYGQISGIMSHAMSLIHKIPLVHSPSQVTTDVGMNIILGLIKGMEDTKTDLYKSATGISTNLINAFKETFQITSPSKVMHDIGQAVGQGFAEGLRGSQDDIKSAFTDMNNKLTDAMVSARDTIKSEQDKLDAAITDTFEKEAKLAKLRAEAKPDAEAIKNALDDLKTSQATIREIQGVLAENQDILDRTTAGHIELTKTLQDEKKTLIGLANDYEVISQKLEDAQKHLADLVQSRKDIIASTTATFAAKPELDTTSAADIAKARTDIVDAIAKRNELQAASEQDQQAIASAQTDVATAQANLAELLKGKTLDSAGNSVDQLATYEDALKHQTTAIGAYNSTLQQLRKLGIDDATYQKLVDDGVADAAFAKQLLAGGHKAVDSLNVLDANLQTVSKRLGTNVGDEMYKSGIKTADKVVAGLKSDEKKNRAEFAQTGHDMMTSLKNALDDDKDGVGDTMEGIGHEMVARMKKALGMKSPSKEMIEIGRLSVEGLAAGLTDNTQTVTDAANAVAQEALTAMQKSMTDIVMGELNASPVITPILDLTTVRDQAKELDNLIPINAATSFNQAAIISSQQATAQSDAAAAASSGASVIFEQHNYSPDALSEIDIYRQTKNQISQLKSALALT